MGGLVAFLLGLLVRGLGLGEFVLRGLLGLLGLVGFALGLVVCGLGLGEGVLRVGQHVETRVGGGLVPFGLLDVRVGLVERGLGLGETRLRLLVGGFRLVVRGLLGLAVGFGGGEAGLRLLVGGFRLLVRGLRFCGLAGRVGEQLRGACGFVLRVLQVGGGLVEREDGGRVGRVGLVERGLGGLDLLQRVLVRGLRGFDLVDVRFDLRAVHTGIEHCVGGAVEEPFVEEFLRGRAVAVAAGAVSAVRHAGGDVVGGDDVEVVADLLVQVRVLQENVVRGQLGEVRIVAGLHGRVVGLLLGRVPAVVRIPVGGAPCEVFAGVVLVVVVVVAGLGGVVGLDHGHRHRGLGHLQRFQTMVGAQLVAFVDHVEGLEQVVEAGRVVLRADVRVFQVLGHAVVGQILVRLFGLVGLEPSGRALGLRLRGLVRGLLRGVRGGLRLVVRVLRGRILVLGPVGLRLRVLHGLFGLVERGLRLVVGGLGVLHGLRVRVLRVGGLVQGGGGLVGLLLGGVLHVVRLVERGLRLVGLGAGLVGLGFRGGLGDGGLGLRGLSVLHGLVGLLGLVLRLLDLGGIVRVARDAGGLVEQALRLVGLLLGLLRGGGCLVGLRLGFAERVLLRGGGLVELGLVGRVDLPLRVLHGLFGLFLGLGGVVTDGLAVVHGLLDGLGVLRALVGLVLRGGEAVVGLVEVGLGLVDARLGGGHVRIVVDGGLDLLLRLLHVLLGLLHAGLGLLDLLLGLLGAGRGLVEAGLRVRDGLLGGGDLVLLGLRGRLGRGLVDGLLGLLDGLLGLFDRGGRGLVGHCRRGDGACDGHGCDGRCESLLVHNSPSNAMPRIGVVAPMETSLRRFRQPFHVPPIRYRRHRRVAVSEAYGAHTHQSTTA